MAAEPDRVARFDAIGTTAVVVTTDPSLLGAAEAVVRAEVAALDLACSRFRPDSELAGLTASAGRWTEIGPVLAGALRAALDAAAATDGLVDPTLGRSLRVLGYDRDLAQLDPDGPALQIELGHEPAWTRVELDERRRRVRLPAGTELDLGATAKAWCADRAAAAAAAVTGGGVLVGLGGDLAVAGPAPGAGWVVQVSDDHAAPTPDDPLVQIGDGGLATSSTTVRRWRRGGTEMHHLLDPATGRPATGPWRTVSVAAASATAANTASTAAVVLGAGAPAWLEARSLPSRLVTSAGEVLSVAGWPEARPGPAIRRAG